MSLPPAHTPNPKGATHYRNLSVCPFKARASQLTSLGDPRVGEDDPLDFGSAYHYAMRLEYENLQDVQAGREPRWRNAYDAWCLAFDQGILKKLSEDQLNRVHSLVAVASPEDGQDGQVLAVEQVCYLYCGEDDAGDPVYYAPTVDLLTQSAGRYNFIDHKTGANKHNDAKQFEFETDLQFIGLAALGLYGFYLGEGDSAVWYPGGETSVQVRYAQSQAPYRVGCFPVKPSAWAIHAFRDRILELRNAELRYAKREAALRAQGASLEECLSAWPRTMGGTGPCYAKYNKGRCDQWMRCRGHAEGA